MHRAAAATKVWQQQQQCSGAVAGLLLELRVRTGGGLSLR
jgi:hypothetical protein